MNTNSTNNENITNEIGSHPEEGPNRMPEHDFRSVSTGGMPQTVNSSVNSGVIANRTIETEQPTILSQEEQKTKVAELQKKYGIHIECKQHSNGGYALVFKSKEISNEKVQEILEAFKDVNVKSLNIEGCNNITQLTVPNSTNLKVLKVSCPNLTQLIVQNSPGLMWLDVYDCQNLHGEIDMSESPQLCLIDIQNCADDFVVVISLECPLVQRLPDNHPHIRINGRR